MKKHYSTYNLALALYAATGVRISYKMRRGVSVPDSVWLRKNSIFSKEQR